MLLYILTHNFFFLVPYLNTDEFKTLHGISITLLLYTFITIV